MAGNGKIAHLPFAVRNQLNERLQNGEEGKDLVRWLNEKLVVKELLEEKFGGRPISEQNLSAWKKREHQEWLKREETRNLLRSFLDEAEELEEQMGDTPLAERLAEMGTLALAQLLRAELSDREKGPKHRNAVVEIVRELTRVRDADHEMERLRLQRERWDFEQDRALEETRKREIEEHRSNIRGRIFSAASRKNLVGAFGGGELGEKIADLFDFVDWGTPLPSKWWDKLKETNSTANPSTADEQSDGNGDQTRSGLIKPNQTNKNGAH